MLRLQVAGLFGVQFDFQLSISMSPTPANDAYSSRVIVSMPAFPPPAVVAATAAAVPSVYLATASGTTLGATFGDEEATLAALTGTSGLHQTVWYAFTAPSWMAGSVNVSISAWGWI